MNEATLEVAIRAARDAAENSQQYKSETYAAVLLFELMRLSSSASRVSNQSPNPPSSLTPKREKPYSAAEFFASKSWITEIDKVVLGGFFLERFGGIENYTIQEIKNCLIAAKIGLPKNVNLAILQAAQKGWIMEIPSQGGPRKSWALTQTGERRVEEMTPGTTA